MPQINDLERRVREELGINEFVIPAGVQIIDDIKPGVFKGYWGDKYLIDSYLNKKDNVKKESKLIDKTNLLNYLKDYYIPIYNGYNIGYYDYNSKILYTGNDI